MVLRYYCQMVSLARARLSNYAHEWLPFDGMLCWAEIVKSYYAIRLING